MKRLLIFLAVVEPTVGLMAFALGREALLTPGLVGGLVGGMMGYVPLGNRYYRGYFRGAIAGGLSAGTAACLGWWLAGPGGWFGGLLVSGVGWPYGLSHAELFLDRSRGASLWMRLAGLALGWVGVFVFAVVLAQFLPRGVVHFLLAAFGWGFFWGIAVELDARRRKRPSERGS